MITAAGTFDTSAKGRSTSDLGTAFSSFLQLRPLFLQLQRGVEVSESGCHLIGPGGGNIRTPCPLTVGVEGLRSRGRHPEDPCPSLQSNARNMPTMPPLLRQMPRPNPWIQANTDVQSKKETIASCMITNPQSKQSLHCLSPKTTIYHAIGGVLKQGWDFGFCGTVVSNVRPSDRRMEFPTLKADMLPQYPPDTASDHPRENISSQVRSAGG